MNLPRLVRDGALFLCLAGLYFVAGKLGLRFAFANPSATLVWAPTGIALAALLRYGKRVWPAIFAAAFLVNLTTAGNVATSIGIAAGNTMEAVTGWWLVSRWAGGKDAFKRAPTVCGFTLASMVATMVSPTVGAGTLALWRLLPWGDYGAVWMTWWLGDVGGALVVAPALLLWSAEWRIRWRPEQSLEAGILLVLLVLTSQVVFGGPFIWPRVPAYPLGFVFIPILLWTAFRLGTREASVALLVLGAVAVDGTMRGVGPFVQATPNDSLLLLGVFIAVASVTTFVFGALVDDRRADEARLRVLAVSDPLTGLANYRQLMTVLQAEIRRSDRTEHQFAIVFLDLDKLKQVNDKHGHLVGSRALCRLAEVIQRSVRAVDTSARFGGDEFAVVLPESDEAAAWQVAHRIRDRLARDPEDPSITASIGVAVYPRDGKTVEELVGRADHLLYQMKATNA